MFKPRLVLLALTVEPLAIAPDGDFVQARTKEECRLSRVTMSVNGVCVSDRIALAGSGETQEGLIAEGVDRALDYLKAAGPLANRVAEDAYAAWNDDDDDDLAPGLGNDSPPPEGARLLAALRESAARMSMASTYADVLAKTYVEHLVGEGAMPEAAVARARDLFRAAAVRAAEGAEDPFIKEAAERVCEAIDKLSGEGRQGEEAPTA